MNVSPVSSSSVIENTATPTTPEYTSAAGGESITVNGQEMTAKQAYEYYKDLIEAQNSSVNTSTNEVQFIAIRSYVNGQALDGQAVTSSDGSQQMTGVTPETAGAVNSTMVAIYRDSEGTAHVEYFPMNMDAREDSIVTKGTKDGFWHVGEGNYEFKVDKRSTGADCLRPTDNTSITVFRDYKNSGSPFEIEQNELDRPVHSTNKSILVHYGGENMTSTNYSSGCLVIPGKENFNRLMELAKNDPDKITGISVVDSSRLETAPTPSQQIPQQIPEKTTESDFLKQMVWSRLTTLVSEVSELMETAQSVTESMAEKIEQRAEDLIESVQDYLDGDSTTTEAKPKKEAPVAKLPQSDLERGDKGADVKLLQERLIDLGYLPKGSNDGDFDPKTEAALKAFQRDAQVKADGEFGPITRAAMERMLTKTSATEMGV